MPEVEVERKHPESNREEARSRSLARGREWGPSIWSPWNALTMSPFTFMRRMSEEMDRTLSGFAEPGDGSGWLPAVDVTERGDNLIVRADLPGINQNDVKVEVTPEGLVIQGERKRENEERGASGYRIERSYGSFYRCIPLPDGANLDAIKAEFKDGVLEVAVQIPDSQRRRRQIPISGGSGERKPASGEAAAARQESKVR
jgi:HSP20 family protein